MSIKQTMQQYKEIGHAYINAANFMQRVLAENELNKDVIARHNAALKKQSKQQQQTIEDMTLELARLEKLLAEKKVGAGV